MQRFVQCKSGTSYVGSASVHPMIQYISRGFVWSIQSPLSKTDPNAVVPLWKARVRGPCFDAQNVRRKSRYTLLKIKSATFSDKSKVLKKKVVQFGLLNKKVFIHDEVITINPFCLFSHTFQQCGSKLREILELCCLEQRLCLLPSEKLGAPSREETSWCAFQKLNSKRAGKQLLLAESTQFNKNHTQKLFV